MKNETEKPAAADIAYETIRSQILDGVLPQGHRLTEQALAADLGLSRTPIRDAIHRLIHEGFVDRGKGYSTRVAQFPEEELEQIFEIRRRLESYAAGRAAKLATPRQVVRLRELSNLMLSHTPPETPEDYRIISTANEEFHQTIYEAACSRRLIAVISVAVDIGVVARTYYLYEKSDLIRSAQHHKEITDAIAAQSSEWASDVMSAHVLAAAAAATRITRNKNNTSDHFSCEG
jgi:DNA-binding GntR family transcriptional regulator